MTSIQDLFSAPASGHSRHAERAVSDEWRLDALLGQTDATADAPVADDAATLQAFVGSRVGAVEASEGAPRPSRLRRARPARDWLSIGAAIVAVVSVGAAATVTAVVLASASPERSALTNLSEMEGRLVDSRENVNRSIATAETFEGDILASSEALPNVLASLSGVSDEPARIAAEQAYAAFVDGLKVVDLPTGFAPYRRGTVDASSLADIGAAIDKVGELQLAVEPAQTQAAEGLRALRAVDQQLTDALRVFTATLPASADALSEQAPAAGEEFHAAIDAAAAAVVDADLRTGAGQAAVTSYTDAVAALRAEQDRVVEAERRAATKPYRSGEGSDSSEGDPGVGETPVTPEPEVTEPSVPDPEPTVEPTTEPTPAPDPDPTAAAG